MPDFEGSVFAKFMEQSYPLMYEATLAVDTIFGGVPYDNDVAEGWIRRNAGETSEEEIQRFIAKMIEERGVTMDEALGMAKNRKVNGFRKDGRGLYIEGRQVKAAIKEAVSVAVAGDKINPRGYGMTNKSLIGFVPEHIFVPEWKVYLIDKAGQHVQKPTGVSQSFISTYLGTGITNTEYVEDVTLNFSILADWPLTEEDWAMIWTTGQLQGIGATRSQGYGAYIVTKWDKVRDVWDQHHAATFAKKAEAHEKKVAMAAKRAAKRAAPAAALAE